MTKEEEELLGMTEEFKNEVTLAMSDFLKARAEVSLQCAQECQGVIDELNAGVDPRQIMARLEKAAVENPWSPSSGEKIA